MFSEQSWCVPTRLSLYTISSSLLTSFLLSCARRFHAPLAYDGHENKGQDEAAEHQGHVEAVQKEDQPLRVLAYVLMQIVVGPPGDQQPANGEVHSPCSKPRPIGDLAHQGQPVGEERDP